MAELPSSAQVVVIGAGIVGNSLVHHLAQLGWTDIVQIDQGPLPNPGGSTGHASNFIFPVDHSREITDLTLDSVRQYKEMGVFTESGGFEVARTEERMEELRRRMSSAKAWGIESALVDKDFVADKVPFLDTDQIVGAFWTPSVGVVDSLRAGTIMREGAVEKGVLVTVPNVEVTALDVEDGHIRRVRTDKGDITADCVVIASGVWSPKIGDMAGVSIPLTPAVHQMISVGPCAQLAEREGEISFPIVRDMDTFCYERQHGADMEVGSYAHRPILHEPEDIPSIEQARLSPTEMPFTEEDFDPQLEQALELMPELLGGEGAEIRYAINGLLSLTCDGWPILGESEVEGLWVAAAVWIKEGPGVGRAVAELMTHGHSEIDISHSDMSRFYTHQKRREHTRLRASEAFNKTYGIVHPAEQYSSDRPQRTSPMYEREKELGAEFFETVGWERPFWYASNAPLLEEYGDRVMPREHEWDSRWWSPIINAEHLAMRERAGMIDLTAFAVFDIEGPGALDAVQRTCVAQCDVAVGKVIYTPVLDAKGGFRSDLTVMRLGDDHFRVVTGGAHGMADRAWFARHVPAGTTLTDRTDEVSTIGLWGPRARDILAAVTSDDVSREGFGFLTCREIDVQGITVLASRISYVGELGWELYVPMGDALALWDALTAAGQEHGLVPVGIGVYGTTGRLEKGYRAYGYELDAERTIVEAGMQRPKVKAADFVGRDAYLAQRESSPVSVLCTLTVEDHTSASGQKRYMLGGEPILTRDGGTLTDGHGHHPYVTTAGSAPSLGKHLLMAYLPPEQAQVGTELAVSYMEELYPVVVAAVDATPLLDPANERVLS
ncbi:GcvT family protein [Nocardioides marmoribigeumensis]|uniref:Glycine cleavage system aminomethyltransferase T/glycine/D-amino acid oxidase-like deaminating enzyme n=1 Tax=Nocardioides marmoribigeumensis TaxID=433649 RepID=A0ABU2BQB3_9ACTN|nr:FAD-dependent oxidoreductase [Nocardioides marmoribigeumensis]MDR7360826.1 glycine cleavage system aminomethyltransferase T/glycine/D-amino acid oxidase-like deaminating enzyme [Nocardioides marmoribigeumensis]